MCNAALTVSGQSHLQGTMLSKVPWFFQVDSQGRCSFDSLCGLTSKFGFQHAVIIARTEGGRPQNLHCAKPLGVDGDGS
jgi:hypothetical protein